MRDCILEAEGISKTFEQHDRVILDKISLSVARNDMIALTGPSGSGKTTLLSILCGLLPPDSGSLRYSFPGEEPVEKLTPRMRLHIGIVFQSIHLIPTLTALENVQIPLIGVEKSEAKRIERARAMLREVGLEKSADWMPNRLSGGERQRVAVARAFVNRPTLIFADEPTGNLDTHSSDQIMSSIISMTEAVGGALFVVTHSQEVASSLPRRLHLKDGRLQDRTAEATRSSVSV